MDKFRERCSSFMDKKRLVLIVAAVAVLLIIIVISVVASKNSKEKSERPIAERVISNMDKENIRDNMKYLAKDPHPAGSPKNLELGREILRRWRDYGFDDAFENTYEVLLSFPTENSYIKYNGGEYRPKNNEGSNVIPPFNAFAKNGKVTAKIVYVNYGRVEDFDKLIDMGVDIKGKIALCRYGKIFRGSKAQNAYNVGLAGMILYSDPVDSAKGKVYPDGKWLPETGVQRGNVKSIKGDISTHLYPSYKGGYHSSGEELAKIAPKIPVFPIPYKNAKSLLQLLETSDLETPDGWVEHNIGPSNTEVTLNVENNDRLSNCTNIIGVINGSVEPDRWVIVGSHRDAWIRGASDPVSGMSIILEITRSLGLEIRKGWRPRRTIIFASWDAEEPGILGSYEFVEDYMTQLKHNAVAYLNMDTAVNNPDMLRMKSTPNMFNLLYSAAMKTKSPDTAYDNLYDFWKGSELKHNNKQFDEPPVQLIGSGSDYTAFLNEVGISCIDFAYKTNYGTYPVYHTQYDTYEWMNKFGDSEFIYHQRLGEYATHVILTLANEPLIKMSVSDYAIKVNSLITLLIDNHINKIIELDLDLNGINILGRKFKTAAEHFTEYLSQAAGNITDESKLRELNDRLMYIDRQFIYMPGLPKRPSFRHLIFAPSSTNTYAGATFPGIEDEMINGNKEDIQRQIGLVAVKLEAVIRSLSLVKQLH